MQADLKNQKFDSYKKARGVGEKVFNIGARTESSKKKAE